MKKSAFFLFACIFQTLTANAGPGGDEYTHLQDANANPGNFGSFQDKPVPFPPDPRDGIPTGPPVNFGLDFYKGFLPSDIGGKGSASRGGNGGGAPGNSPTTQNNPSPKQKSDPASTNNTKPNKGCPNDGNAASGNPVILATGEKFKVETDVIRGNVYSLGLTRTYKSAGRYGNLFGPHWFSDYDYLLSTSGAGCVKLTDYPGKCIYTQALLTFPDGSSYTYKLTSGTNEPITYSVNGSSSMGTLVYDPDTGWKLTTPTLNYQYSVAGNIKSVVSAGGTLLLGFTYGSNTKLPIKVTNAAGQAISFTYDPTTLYVAKVTDPSGNAWNYTYNSSYMLSSVTSPGASPDVRTYYYESSVNFALLTGISINGSRYSTYSYNANQTVSSSGLTGGEQNDTFSYGSNATTVTDAKGQPVTYNFVSVQGGLKLSSVSRANTSTCAAALAQTVYDSNGWVSYTLDWNGKRTNYSYDVAGKLLSVTSPVGTSTVNTWTGDNLTTVTYKDSAGNAYASTVYTYLALGSGFGGGNLTSITQRDWRTGVQRQTSYGYTYSGAGVISLMTVSQALPSGSAVTTYNYDTYGNLSSVVNALNQATTFTNYNGLGFPGRMTDPNGTITDYVYNGQGTMASATQAVAGGSRVTTYSYNHDRQVTAVAYADGHVSRYQYNAAGRREYAGNALGEYVHLAYDVPSITSTISSARSVPTSSGGTPVANGSGNFSAVEKLDSLGRPLVDTGNNGQRVTFTYDANGNVKTRVDMAGHTTQYAYDGLNRLTMVTAPDNGVTTYAYNAEGRLGSITDPRSLSTSYVYNGLGQVTSQTSPDTGATTFTYDSAGRLASKALADGVTITYAWDSLNRPTSRTSAGVTETLTYDTGTNGVGHLTQMSDGSGSTTFSYSAAGELLAQVNNIVSISYNTGWTYDSAGHLTGISYPNGFSVGYAYDAYGRVSRVTSNLGGTWATLADSFLYEPATDRRYAWRFGNNLPRLVTLDADGRITALTSGGVHNLGLGYTSVNTVASKSDNVDGSQSANYAYDPADRLATVSNSSDAQGFGWDDVGNRTSQSRQGAGYGITLVSGSNRLATWSAPGISRSFGYNASGNVTSESRSDGNRTYGYDAFDRMANATINGTVVGTYWTNAMNQRAARSAAGVGTRYAYAPSGALFFETSNYVDTYYVWIGDELLGMARSAQFYASHNDQIGRPEVLSNSSAGVAWRAKNTPFERTIITDSVGGMDVGLPGQNYDAETGLWNNWNRMYDGQLGRYLQSDPIGLQGGINTYAYVGGNPLRYTDTNGLQRLPDYVTFQLDAYVFSISATFTKYGDVFLGKGVSRPYLNPLSGGVSISNGWKTSCSADGPSKDELNNFLDGYSRSAGGYLGVGGSYSTNAAGSAWNVGVGFGGVSLSPGSDNSYRGNLFGGP